MAKSFKPRQQRLILGKSNDWFNDSLLDKIQRRRGQKQQKKDPNKRPSQFSILAKNLKESGFLGNITRTIPILGPLADTSPADLMYAVGRANPFLGMLIGGGRFLGQTRKEYSEAKKVYDKRQQRIRNLQLAREVQAQKRLAISQQLDEMKQNYFPELILRVTKMLKYIEHMRAQNLLGPKKSPRYLQHTGYYQRATVARKDLVRMKMAPSNKDQPKQIKTLQPLPAEILLLRGLMRRDFGAMRRNLPQKVVKKIPAFKDGGIVKGKGTGTSDSVPAMLSNGEFVVSAKAVKMIGTGFLSALNEGKDNGAVKQVKAQVAKGEKSPTVKNYDEALVEELQKLVALTTKSVKLEEQKQVDTEKQEAIQIKTSEENAEKMREEKTWRDKVLGALADKGDEKKDDKRSIFGKMLASLARVVGPLVSGLASLGSAVVSVVKMLGGVGNLVKRVMLPLYLAWEMISNIWEGYLQNGLKGAIGGFFEGFAEFLMGAFVEFPAMIIDTILGAMGIDSDLSGFVSTVLMPYVENIGENMVYLFDNIGTILSNIPKMLVKMVIDALPGPLKTFVPDGLENWANDLSSTPKPTTEGQKQAAKAAPAPKTTAPTSKPASAPASKSSAAPKAAPAQSAPATSKLPQAQQALTQTQAATQATPAPVTVVNAPSTNVQKGGQQSAPAPTIVSPRNTESTLQYLNKEAFAKAY